MRISQRLLIDSAIYRLEKNQTQVDDLRTRIATGRSIQKPSDDPQGTQQGINLRSHLNVVQTTLGNLNFSEDWMSASASSLQALSSVLGKTKVQALQALNDTLSDSEREVFATATREALNQAVNIANTEHRGQFLFAGYRIDTRPFELDTTDLSVTYGGDNGAIVHEVEPGSQTTVNVAGNQPLFAAAFQSLAALAQALEANDSDATRDAIGALEAALDLTLEQTAILGSRMDALTGVRLRLEQAEVDITALLSQTEETDIPATVLKLGSAELGYQATLETMSRVMPRTLFDYLG